MLVDGTDGIERHAERNIRRQRIDDDVGVDPNNAVIFRRPFVPENEQFLPGG
jgi:hypothetical protein